jgi:hypothetical protein
LLLNSVVRGRSGRRFLIGFLRVAFVGFVTANKASGNSAHLAVPCHVAGHASNDGAFNASLRLDCGGSARQAQNDASKDQRLHHTPPRRFAATILALAIGSEAVKDDRC